MSKATFHDMYMRLIGSVYSEDLEVQEKYLSVVEAQRNIPVEYLLRRGCLFVPNNEYLHYHLGHEADIFGYELYNEGKCLWTHFVLLPIHNLLGDVVGLTGWDAYHKYIEITEEQWGLSMYKVSSSNVFEKEKYFLSDIDLLKNTFDSHSIFITDGVFDSVALNSRGIPALALLGSTFSKENLYFLRWYKNVYVCADNDRAGLQLYSKLSKSLPHVYKVVQSKAKDIEELLREDPVDGPLTRQLLEATHSAKGADIYLKA